MLRNSPIDQNNGRDSVHSFHWLNQIYTPLTVAAVIGLVCGKRGEKDGKQMHQYPGVWMVFGLSIGSESKKVVEHPA
jgi:hypothetical protein